MRIEIKRSLLVRAASVNMAKSNLSLAYYKPRLRLDPHMLVCGLNFTENHFTLN